MSHRVAGTAGNVSQFTLPRGWIILGLGSASWLALAGLFAITSTAFQSLLFVVG